jgi:hypothetical protein
MLSDKNATKYVKNNLKSGGIAVMNVGGYNNGAVFVYTKDKDGNIKKRHSGLNVIFQEDQKP